MLRVSQRASHYLRAVSQARPTGLRTHATQAPLREFFVHVSDRPSADRNNLSKSDLVPEFCTFSGECLSPGSPGQPPRVVGNAFACLAPDVEGVQAMMESSVYNKQKIWDMPSMAISPLLTVHSSDHDATSSYESPPTDYAAKLERLVILPDKPNVLARRVAIRPRHSPNFVRLHNEGYVSWAGPIFEKHVDTDISKRPFKGSVMVVNESDWSGFMEKVQSDIYVKEQIWDMDKASFIPFRTLTRHLE